MKDSYSFDLDDDGLAASYAAHRDAYQRIFARLGLKLRDRRGQSPGAMGGSASEEFLADSEVGEDTYVRCLESGVRRQRRGGDHARCRSRCRSTACPQAEVYDTP